MPRPKVKPQDRQRSARACLPCKASKIRCDAGTPCGPCLKRERISACVYLESSRKRQKTNHNHMDTSPFPTPSIEDASPQFEDISPGAQHVHPVAPVAPVMPAEVRAIASTAATTTNTTTSTPEPGKDSSRLTQSRMLLSSKGEKCMPCCLFVILSHVHLPFSNFAQYMLARTLRYRSSNSFGRY